MISTRSCTLDWRFSSLRPVRCARGSRIVALSSQQSPPTPSSRRSLLTALSVAILLAPNVAHASSKANGNPFAKELKSRRTKIPLDQYKESEEAKGLLIYDVKPGSGRAVVPGDRIAIHYEAKWKNITFMTSRQGMGVTGGTPLGFDVGGKVGQGGTLKAIDLAVRGMRVGGQRKIIAPPDLCYGDKGYGEIPPGASLEFDVQLLSIKQNAFGTQVKLVEG